MSDVDKPAHKKRKAGGRPADERIWKHFKQIALPPEKAEKAKRNHDAECSHCGTVVLGRPYKMKEHLSLCDEASNSDRMEADTMQISNAASTSSQPAVVSPRKITSYVDRVKITAAQQLRFSTLLCIAFVTCGWSFRTVENSEFKVFMQNIRPNYQLPSECFSNKLLAVSSDNKLMTCKGCACRCRCIGWHSAELCGSFSQTAECTVAAG